MATDGYSARSFAHPETRFELIISQTPLDEDPVGFKLGEPTGMVRCCACEGEARNVDEISHAPDCPQRFVRSKWWREQFVAVCSPARS